MRLRGIVRQVLDILHKWFFCTGRSFMASMEEIELEKRRKAIDKDVASLLDKYLRAMEWDIPEADEAKARQMILDEFKAAISRLESQA
jgi:hypothetical protein